MKTFPRLFCWGGQILIALLLSGCAGSTANNKSLDYDQLEVVFELSMPDDVVLGADALFGVGSTCTRDGKEDVAMNAKGIAAYRPNQTQGYLVKASDDDAVVAYESDVNYHFYSFYPYDPSATDLSALDADVPAVVGAGNVPSPLYVASNARSSVVAPVKLDFKRMTCTLAFTFGTDIISSEADALKSVVLRPAVSENFTGALAYDAVYDLYNQTLIKDEQSVKKEIMFDFGQSGMELDGYTSISCEVAPFTVPEGGFELVFTDVSGNSNTVTIMDSEVTKSYPAGSVSSMVVTAEGTAGGSEGQSVRWPIGFYDGVGGTNPRNIRDSFKDLWQRGAVEVGTGSHIWPSAENQSATMEFVFSEEHKKAATAKVMFEFQENAAYNYGSPVVKNFFTNDYFEFTAPVTYLKAGSKVTIEAPIYSRGAPIFWNIEYLDGGVWKCNKYEQESLDVINGSTEKAKATCTWVLPHGAQKENFEGVLMKHSMIFENVIKDGYIKIRMRAVGDENGIYMTHQSATYSNKAYLTKTPIDNNGNALVAFCNKSNTYDAITIKWE